MTEAKDPNQFNTRLDPNTKKDFKALARKKGMTIESLTNEVIRSYVEQQKNGSFTPEINTDADAYLVKSIGLKSYLSDLRVLDFSDIISNSYLLYLRIDEPSIFFGIHAHFPRLLARIRDSSKSTKILLPSTDSPKDGYMANRLISLKEKQPSTDVFQVARSDDAALPRMVVLFDKGFYVSDEIVSYDLDACLPGMLWTRDFGFSDTHLLMMSSLAVHFADRSQIPTPPNTPVNTEQK